MVKICQMGLLKLNFETRPKKRNFRFLPKMSAGHGWSWKFFFANFQILGPLGCQGCEKSQNHCTLLLSQIGLRLRNIFYLGRSGCSVYPFVTNGLRVRVIKKCFKLGKKIFLFKTIFSMTPLYLLKIVFSNIWSIICDRNGFLCDLGPKCQNLLCFVWD